MDITGNGPEGLVGRVIHLVGAMALAVVVFLSLAGPARANLILGSFDWDPSPGAGAFTSGYGWTTIDTPASGGDPGGWLSVTFPAIALNAPAPMWEDVIRTPASNLFAGAWTTNAWIQFDFWESNVVANAVHVMWKSTTNDTVWEYSNLTPPPVQTWSGLTAGFRNWLDWEVPGTTEAQYLSDLQTIDWVGVYISRNTNVEQVYGVDNMKLEIPEPAECFMLAAAVISSGLSLRRKRRRIVRGMNTSTERLDLENGGSLAG